MHSRDRYEGPAENHLVITLVDPLGISLPWVDAAGKDGPDRTSILVALFRTWIQI